MYTNKKPLVIVHESLASFVRVTGTRPVVIKLHGDARLAPKNTNVETSQLQKALTGVLRKLLAETGLIFVGYGGNDASIASVLSKSSPPWGVFWVNENPPGPELAEWLKGVGGTWVKHRDFDELMLLIKNEFGL